MVRRTTNIDPRRPSPRRTRRPVQRRSVTEKKRKVNYFRFGVFLLIIFIASFFVAGGTELFSKPSVSSITQTVEQAGKEKLNKAVDEKLADMEKEDTTPSVTDRLGRLIFLDSAVQKKIKAINGYTKIDKTPEALQQAVVAVEDNRFYEHWGFDISGIARASLVNLQYGEVKEGASTITQQLVKNMFLSQEQSFGRKAEELLLAIDMELHYSKAEILEMYLNSIYFGSGYYGIQEASEGYFGKSPEKLDLAEASVLAGVPNAPSLYSPYVDFILAKKRQIIVLDAMVKNGYLRESVAEDAKIKPLILAH